MSIQVNNIDKTKKVNASNGNGQNNFSTVDNDMTMNGSIFNKIQNGNSKTSEAKEAGNDANSWTAVCKTDSTKAQNLTTQAITATKNLFGKIAAATKKVIAEQKTIEAKENDNQNLETEIESLSNERDTIADSTGAGTRSAFSLTLPGGGVKAQGQNGKKDQDATLLSSPNAAQPTEGEEESGNETKLAEIDAQIATKSSKIKANTTQLTSAQKRIKATNKQIDAVMTRAMKTAGQASSDSAKGQSNASAANTVGTVTTAVGGLTSAVGASMMAFVPTAAAGAKVAAVGAVTTAAGSATTVASDASKGDWEATASSATNLANSVGKAGADWKKTTEPKTKTQTQNA